jgi:transcriptional regulator with XRE-family HTH domain
MYDPSRYKEQLKFLGWSQQTFADRLGVTDETVSRWMTGRQLWPRYAVEYLRICVLAKKILFGDEEINGSKAK